MMIGTFGNMPFEVSENKAFTPSSFRRTAASRWTTHDVSSGKPRTEYIGADLMTVSFEVTLRASLGIKPREILDRLAAMAEGSEVHELVIGGRPVAPCVWRLVQVSEAWDVIMNEGELFSATVSLTLEEYQ